MTTPAQVAVLRYLDEEDGKVTVGATRDPQWNDATAERKHARDLAVVVRDDAGLDLGIREVEDLLDSMIKDIEAKIDGTVYGLFELDDDEREVIEGHREVF